jgi:nucleotide-binding universal stress UspA family protein
MELADQARQSVLVARGPSVSRVLVAADGSEGAARIPDALASWAAFRGFPGIALSVAPVSSPAFELMVSLYTMGDASAKQQREELLAQYRAHADAMAKRLDAAGIPAVAEVRVGDAAQEIVNAGKEHQADLIITGSRSLHGVDRLLLGSVARNVLQHAHASVLVVRPPEAPRPG